MNQEKEYYVYILTNKRHNVLYIGVTSDLVRRITEHKEKAKTGFTSQYNVTLLVYYESTNDITVAIHRETCLKRWKREWKERIISEQNPTWRDLFAEISE